MAKQRKKETWADWQGFPVTDFGQLFGRKEFVKRAYAQGIDVTEGDLLYWQRVGAIPYPVKRRVRRTSYAVYPFWMIDVISSLRELQKAGFALSEIGNLLRPLAAEWAKETPKSGQLPGWRCPCCGQLMPQNPDSA